MIKMNIAVLWLYTRVYSMLVLIGQVHSTVKLQSNGTNPEGLVLVDKGNGPQLVCNGCWKRSNTIVVCRELGHGNGVAWRTKAEGYSTLPGYSCIGNETSLEDCASLYTCACREKIVVRCKGAVRVRPASSSAPIGIIEVFLQNRYGDFRWGSLYSDAWENTEADVVCRQLGYRSGIAVGITFPDSINQWKRYYSCYGNESNLNRCKWNSINKCNNCNEFAGVQCIGGDDITTHGSIQNLTTQALDTEISDNSSSSAENSTFAFLGLIAILPLTGILVFIVIRVKRSRNANVIRRTTEQPMELQSPIPDQDRIDTQNAPGVYEGLVHPNDQSRNSHQYETLGSGVSRDSSEEYDDFIDYHTYEVPDTFA